MTGSIVRRLRTIGALIMINGLIPIRRSPLWLVVQLAIPLTIIFFISLYAPEEAISEAIIGGLITIMVSAGLALQSDIVWYRVEIKFQDMAVASPISPVDYMFGIAFSELAYSSPAVALFLGMAAMRGLLSPQTIPILILSLLLTWVFALSTGFYLATKVTDLRHVWALSGLLSILISMIPPVYYSVDLLPQWIRPIALLVPTTHAALLAKNAAGITVLTAGEQAASLITLMAWSIGFIILASKKSMWRER